MRIGESRIGLYCMAARGDPPPPLSLIRKTYAMTTCASKKCNELIALPFREDIYIAVPVILIPQPSYRWCRGAKSMAQNIRENPDPPTEGPIAQHNMSCRAAEVHCFNRAEKI